MEEILNQTKAVSKIRELNCSETHENKKEMGICLQIEHGIFEVFKVAWTRIGGNRNDIGDGAEYEESKMDRKTAHAMLFVAGSYVWD